MKTLLLSICLLLAACVAQPPLPPKKPVPPPSRDEIIDFIRRLERVQS